MCMLLVLEVWWVGSRRCRRARPCVTFLFDGTKTQPYSKDTKISRTLLINMFKRLSLGETALAHFRELHEGLNPLGHLAAVGDGAGRGVDRDRQSQHGAPGGRRPRAGSGIAIGDADAADKHRNGGRPGAVRAIRRHPRGHGDVHLVVLRVGARVNDAGGPGGDCSRGGIQGRPQTAQAIPEPLNEGRAAPVRGAPPPLSAPRSRIVIGLTFSLAFSAYL